MGRHYDEGRIPVDRSEQPCTINSTGSDGQDIVECTAGNASKCLSLGAARGTISTGAVPVTDR
jgi:hypothetical protein